MKRPDGSNRYARMFAALGSEARLQILRLLLSAHPEGLVVGAIQETLSIPGSTLSHHLEKLKQQELVVVQREGAYLWYRANTNTLQELLGFLFAECCSRNRVVQPELVILSTFSPGGGANTKKEKL